jgi:uncharacterized protein (DUF1501 family)
VPRFAPTPWQGIEPASKEDLDTPDMMERLQRALWLLEHDLTSSVFVCLVGGSLNWDTHTDNARRQTRMQARFVPMLDRFLTELERRSNRHGRLVDNTAVIVASELGRYPFLNAAQGKDHFPEAPFLFSGPWFPGGKVFGRTGKNLEAQPIDLKQGGVARAGGHHVMVDDVGTTLLALSGIDPELYGYNGQHLQFLLRG